MVKKIKNSRHCPDLSPDLASGVERHRLGNGMTVLLREDHAVPVVTSMIWYKVGSRNEADGQRGISHLLEHLMFKGAGRFAKGEIDAITTCNGGSNNAFTSADTTAFHFSFASDRWQHALEIEASRMHDNHFDPHEYEMERKVVLEELRMDLDSPWGRLRRDLELLSFRNHPYRYPVIGLQEDLESLQMEQVIDFYRRYYTPNNAVLVLAGDFEGGEALDRVQELFGDIAERPLAEACCATEPQRSQPVRFKIRRGRLDRLLISWPAPAATDPAHFAMQVLDRIISEGKLARLYRRLVEGERVASFASAELNETMEPYLYLMRCELQPEAEAEQAELLILDEVDQLRSEPVGEDELRRAHNQCCTQVLLDFETSLDQAAQLGLMETLGGFEYWHGYLERIRSVSAQDVLEAARQFLAPERAAVGVSVRSNGGVS